MKPRPLAWSTIEDWSRSVTIFQTKAEPTTSTETAAPVAPPETQSGEWLLIEAYVAIWALTFLFIFFAWRRTRSLESKLEAIELGLKRARVEHEKARAADPGAKLPREAD